MSEVDNEWLTPRQVAELYGVTVQTVRNWITSGRLPAVKDAGRVKIRAADAEKLRQPYQPKEVKDEAPETAGED